MPDARYILIATDRHGNAGDAPARPGGADALDDARRRLAPHAVERSPARAVLEPRDRRLRRLGRAPHRVSPEQQLVDRVVRQVVGIVAIAMTGRDAEDPPASWSLPESASSCIIRDWESALQEISAPAQGAARGP